MAEDFAVIPDPGVSNYGWQSANPPDSQDYISPAILEILQDVKLPKVLDLGSGNGALCHLLHARGFDVVGAEADLGGVEIAKNLTPGIPFYCLRVEDDPMELVRSHGLFDVVVSTEVIEHLYSPHLLPRFAWRCLRPGGLLVVSTPYHGYLKNLALSLIGKWDHHHTALWHGGHIKFWSRATLTQLLVDDGFVLEAFRGVGRLPYLWKSMILIVRKPLISE
jgi:2-polyprenyl-3-methyl-5-hydroxy-6-metoxy-1,4-benzoquinol methylase